MAGRGRGATLPAWMTAGGGEVANGSLGVSSISNAQFEDSYLPATNTQNVYDSQQRTGVNVTDGRVGGRSREPRGVDRSLSSDRRRRDRSASPKGSTRVWKPRDSRISNFDVRPPDGMELPPIGVINPVNGVPNSYYSYANNPAVAGGPPAHLVGSSAAASSKYGQPQATKTDPNAALMVTRHARRIYAGGIPPRATEGEIMQFFNDVVTRALYPQPVPPNGKSPPVIKVYLNIEKCYAFVEFTTIELTTACMQLDGIKFDHYTGTTIVRVRRPNDYRPELLPANLGPIPVLNLDGLGSTGTATVTNGPGKVFIGGLPYNLQDEQVMELLGAFGPIKAFHQVRDPGSVTSKGYGFCEYVDQSHAIAAIEGLNGMPLGEKVLSVRAAVTNAVPGAAAVGTTNPMQQQSMMMASGGGGMNINPMLMGGGISSNSYSNNLGYSASVLPSAVANTNHIINSGIIVPTKVLRLSNMVTREDLYNEAEFRDIIEDVRLECQEHGQVLNVIIPRQCDGYMQTSEGLIFVEFNNADHARAAARVLNGRKFADKTVLVQYFDEGMFAAQQLI